MTLAVVFKGSDGLALAVDSRITLCTRPLGGEAHYSHFDNATKLLSFKEQPHVGVVAYGTAAIGNPPRTIHGFIPEFEARLHDKYAQSAPRPIDRGTVADIAAELGDFYAQQWKDAAMPAPGGGVEPITFLVAGFDKDEPYGRIYEVSVPNATSPTEKNQGTAFGLLWGGMGDMAHRIFNGTDPRALKIAKDHLKLTDQQTQELAQKWANELSLPVPYQFLPLQDCIDLSAFLVNLTSAVQTWTVGIQGVGGAVDVGIITRTDGFKAIRQKRIEVRE